MRSVRPGTGSVRATLTALAIVLAGVLDPTGQPPRLFAAPHPALLEVTVNGGATGTVSQALVDEKGQVWVRELDLRKLRLTLPAADIQQFRGDTYLGLHPVDGVQYRVDHARQALDLVVEPRLLSTTRQVAAEARSTVSESSVGGFINYDLNAQWGDGQRRLDGLVELGLFHPGGSGTMTLLGRDLDGEPQWTRLDTSWGRDDPTTLRALRLGDSITRAWSWGRPLRFGGLQWGSDFTTRPGFVTFPLPAARGEAVLPSTVEVFVDNVLRYSTEVPAGPFTLDRVPVLSGGGSMQVVVQDLLGRETVQSLPYYAAPTLLRAGLSSWVIEGGWGREDYGVESDHYGHPFLSATWRTGLSDTLTSEVHAETLADQQTVAAAATAVWPKVGVIEGGVAASRGPGHHTGTLAAVGFSRQTRQLSLSVRAATATKAFRQLGDATDDPVRSTLQLQVSTRLGPGSASLAYARQDRWNGEERALVSASYNQTIGRELALSLFWNRDLAGDDGDTVGVALSHAFGDRTAGGTHVTADDSGTRAGVQLRRSLPEGSGWGYHASWEGGDLARREAGVAWQGDHGTYVLDAARMGDSTSFRAGARGGIAYAAGETFASRPIEESFAVVEVPDSPGVTIYRENQPAAVTNDRGRAVIPRLLPFQDNHLSIDQADLPMDAQVDAVKLAVAPPRRSGVKVTFPVQRVKGVLLSLVLPDGTPVPAGATVQVEGRGVRFPVALRGEAYITGLDTGSHIVVSWAERQCAMTVTLPPVEAPVLRVGPLVCEVSDS